MSEFAAAAPGDEHDKEAMPTMGLLRWIDPVEP